MEGRRGGGERGKLLKIMREKGTRKVDDRDASPRPRLRDDYEFNTTLSFVDTQGL